MAVDAEDGRPAAAYALRVYREILGALSELDGVVGRADDDKLEAIHKGIRFSVRQGAHRAERIVNHERDRDVTRQEGLFGDLSA